MTLDLSSFLNLHRNKLLAVAQNSGIPLSSFNVSVENNRFVININETPLSFIAQQSGDFNSFDYKCTEFKTGFPISSITPKSGYINIKTLCGEFEKWLETVAKKYLMLADVPDRWQEMQSIQPFIATSSFTETDFELFTDDERINVREALSEFERLLKEEISPVREDLESVLEKLEYLSNAVDRLNRFDWKGIATSTVIGIATNLSVDAETGKHILQLFQQAFSSVIGLLPK